MFLLNHCHPQYDLAPFEGEPIFYLICGAPRVGSNLLCELLRGSGVMGVPAEYFHPTLTIPQMAQRLGLLHNRQLDLAAYIEAVKNIRTTPNGVFGVKIQYWMMPPLIKRRLISRHFPGAKFIYLTRSDPVAQGVSFELALQTNQWSSLNPEKEASYDKQKVLGAINTVLKDQISWEVFFSLNDIEPFRATYERLVAETEKVCEQVCDYVGVMTDCRFSIDKAETKRQRSSVNAEWTKRLKQSMGY